MGDRLSVSAERASRGIHGLRADLGAPEKELVYHGNAERVFHIKPA